MCANPCFCLTDITKSASKTAIRNPQKLDSFAQSTNFRNPSLWPPQAASHLFVHLTLLGWAWVP